MKTNSYTKNVRALIVGLAVVVGGRGLAIAAHAQDRGFAQSGGVEGKTTRVTLSPGSATVGTMAMIPIYLTPAEGTKVGSLELDINFVSVNLKFDKLEPGIAAEQGHVQLSSEVEKGTNEQGAETSTVKIRAKAPSGNSIPGGLLGFMTLRVSETGRPATIALRVKAEAREAGSGQAVANVEAADSKVEVVAPEIGQPPVACFFFTH